MDDPIIIVPARGGSRRLPQKNLRALHGRPLLWWTLDFAAAVATDILVLTDSKEVQDATKAWEYEGTGYGRAVAARVVRQAAGAAWDRTPMASAVMDGLRALDALGRDVETAQTLVLLQPSTPYRSLSLYDAVVRAIGRREDEPCYVSAYSTWDDLRRGRPDGAIYAVKSDWLWATARLLPEPSCAVVNGAAWHVDIDTAEDLARAEGLTPP